MTQYIEAEWPELSEKVVIEPFPDGTNKVSYDWFLNQCKKGPLKGIQNHAAINGKMMYMLDLPIHKEPVVNYTNKDLKPTFLPEAEVGLFNANPVSTNIQQTVFDPVIHGSTSCRIAYTAFVYGPLTEDMNMYFLGKVREEDIGTLMNVGEMVWDAQYHTHKMITGIFRVAEL